MTKKRKKADRNIIENERKRKETKESYKVLWV